MKKIIINVLALLILAGCSDKKKTSSFELKGKLTGTNGEFVFLEKLNSQQPVSVDSAELNDKGEFEFINYTPKMGFYRIRYNQQSFAMLVLDSADKVFVTGDLKDLGNTYKVEGSPETKLFLEYQEFGKQRDIRLDSLNKAFQAIVELNKLNEKKMDSLSATFETPYNAIVNPANKALGDKIIANNSMYSSIMAIQTLDYDKNKEVYKELDAGLIRKFPEDKIVMMFHEDVLKKVASAEGMAAPEINLMSPEGKEISLSSFRGKVVLIDFWASWCGPCRKEMPNVVAAYKKFKSKGFEIYGVSLDQDKDRWIQAIAKDGITWAQVSDLKQWNSSVVPLYNISAIPYTVLLNKEGKIIAKNLRGAELEQKLAEVLN